MTATLSGPKVHVSALSALAGAVGLEVSSGGSGESGRVEAVVETATLTCGRRKIRTSGLVSSACTMGSIWGKVDLRVAGSVNLAVVEGWVGGYESTVGVVAQTGIAGGAYGKSVVGDFAGRLDKYLETNTFLTPGGEGACWGDVVIAVGLNEIGVEGANLANLKRWIETVCQCLGIEVKSEKKEEKKAKKEEKKTSGTGEKEIAAVKPPAPPAAGDLPVVPSSDSEYKSNKILTHLTSLSITSTTYSHAAAFTSDELAAAAGSLTQHCKNIFLKDKKHGLFLVTAHPTSDTNGKVLAKALGLTGSNMRMAKEDLLGELLDVKKGSVGPMCVLADTGIKVNFVLDQRLVDCETVYSHPGRNDWSVGISPKDLIKFVESTGHEVKVVELGEKGDAGSGPLDTPKGAVAGKDKKDKKDKPKQAKEKGTKDEGGTLLALQYKKMQNFAEWYSDVIVLSEMIGYYDISGCYILRPWSYSIWDSIQTWFNGKLGPLEVQNCYFPLFVSKSRLEKEKDHVEGFAPEVAWVTKSGDGDLAEHIAIRPTSETIMYPAFSDWIRSHRDLPLKLNQWSNVVRWEFKYPTPFLRSREFLWQEGHTAHATYEEADEMVMSALELYRGVYEDLLAVPVIRGYKTEKERFAGGYMTTTCEAYIPASGRAIQGATSHNLGQNFGKMFEINFQDKEGKTKIPWQTSWGITTRTIGVMVMVHGDDQGLVLPPRISPQQVVIIPIISKKCGYDVIAPYCEALKEQLSNAGLRAKYDGRSIYSPGWKFNHWEQKGVPIRVEVGPRDVENKACRICVRHSGEKYDAPVEGLAESLLTKMEEIQDKMFQKVKKERDDHLVKVTEWKDFVPNLEKGNLILTPWCGGEHQDWEEWVKEKSREEAMNGVPEDERTSVSVAGKTLCIPFEQPELPAGTKCFASGLEAKCWVLWGRSY